MSFMPLLPSFDEILSGINPGKPIKINTCVVCKTKKLTSSIDSLYNHFISPKHLNFRCQRTVEAKH